MWCLSSTECVGPEILQCSVSGWALQRLKLFPFFLILDMNIMMRKGRGELGVGLVEFVSVFGVSNVAGPSCCPRDSRFSVFQVLLETPSPLLLFFFFWAIFFFFFP